MADGRSAVTPKSMVLDLMRVAAPEPCSVRALIDVGSLFGFEANAVRVAVARLNSRGLVEPMRRGWYRFAVRAQPLSAFVEQWRLGERRMIPWRGDWLAVWQPRSRTRKVQARDEAALRRLGFVPGPSPLRLRPNNLASRVDGTRERLASLGLSDGAELFVMSEISSALRRELGRAWPGRRIRNEQRRACTELRASAERLEALDHDQALVETFMLGGAAIRLLSLDPLLPDELVDGSERRELTEQMLHYDRLGRDLWRQAIDRAKLESAPTNLGSLAQENAA